MANESDINVKMNYNNKAANYINDQHLKVHGTTGAFDVTFTGKNNKSYDPLKDDFDKDWLKSNFIIGDNDFDPQDQIDQWIMINRYRSTADIKFTSTAPGMNTAVNPKPQFTRYADIRSPGVFDSRRTQNKESQMSMNTGAKESKPIYFTPHYGLGTDFHTTGLGMGRYYSEAYDDTEQRIYLRFGSPAYMPMFLWISTSFNVNKLATANRGAITSLMLRAIDTVSKVLAFAFTPMVGFGVLLLNFIFQPGRFTTLSANMYNYWSTVEHILNSFVIKRTMVPFLFEGISKVPSKPEGSEPLVEQSYVEKLNKMLPGVIDGKTGRISVLAFAQRAQGFYNKMLQEDLKAQNEYNGKNEDFEGFNPFLDGVEGLFFRRDGSEANPLKNYFTRWMGMLGVSAYNNDLNTDEEGKSKATLINISPIYTTDLGLENEIKPDENKPTEDQSFMDKIGEVFKSSINTKQAFFNQFSDAVLAELADGSAFAVFNVDSTGSIAESFTNSVTSNPIESVFNSISAKARNMTSTLAQFTDIPILSDAVKFLGDAAAITLSNYSWGIADPAIALAYGAQITLPKKWDASSASLPRASYKIKLISPYGNAYSQLFNIYLPLSMLLAGALPRATGSTSYTSPFLCQLYDKGRVNVALGIIDSLTVTRGTSNLAFTKAGHPNAIDVDFSITNLDEILAVDTEKGGFIGAAENIANVNYQVTPFDDYINTVTGVDVYSQFYKLPNIRFRLAEKAMAFDKLTSLDPSAFGSMVVSKVPILPTVGRWLSHESAALLQDLQTR